MPAVCSNNSSEIYVVLILGLGYHPDSLTTDCFRGNTLTISGETPMTNTSRRNAMKIAGIGSMLAAAPAPAQHQSISGPLSNATVSFGQ